MFCYWMPVIYFQGTPYFNFYKGEPEIKAMSSMGYEATTIGNHDFDAGLGEPGNAIDKSCKISNACFQL